MSAAERIDADTRAADLRRRGITINTGATPAPWRIHGAWAAQVVRDGRVLTTHLGDTQADAVAAAVEAAEGLVAS